MKNIVEASLRIFVMLAFVQVAEVASRAQTVAASPVLDMDRFTGTWYVVAELPEKRDKHCLRNAILMVALGDKPRSVQLLNACQNKLGFTESRNTDGKAENTNGDGKLKLRTVWPFSRKISIIALGSDYEWSLVGSPNHKTLAILSKTATLNPATLADIEARASSQGYPVGKLILFPQEARYKAE